MASILDDLKGILSAEDFAKLESNSTMRTRLARGEELLSYYESGEEPVVSTGASDPVRTATPPPARGTDLQDIERMLDSRLGTLNQTIESKINDAVKARGDELYNNVRSGVRGDALQLVKIYTRHQNATGKEWDDAEETKFNDFLKSNQTALTAGTGGKPYRNLTEAYNDYISPVVTERTIEDEVAKRVKAQSGASVPGTTPSPSANSNVRFFKTRTVAGDGARETGASRAAALLDRRMAEAQSA